MTTPFSVLLPVYRGDDPGYFRRSIESVTVEQTLRPDELVIVRDGPVGQGIADVLDAAVTGGLTGGVPVTLVALEHNVGLARALEAGLKRCTHEVVARADADDISLPRRFELQIPRVAAGLDLLGSAITEFETDENHPGMVRRFPTRAEEIAALARFRDPFNHPSVVFRRSAVERAGGYEHVDKMEDYWLWARMLQQGARVANLPESLVLYRVGAGAYGRRGGLDMLRSELALQSLMRRSGFTTRLQALRNVLVRGSYRLVPGFIRKAGYRLMIRL